MTSEEIISVKELHMQGLTSGEIAQMLNISKNTIRSYMRRHKEEFPDVVDEDKAAVVKEKIKQEIVEKQISSQPPSRLDLVQNARCLNCGKILYSVPGRKQKKFCDYDCRMKFWGDHRDLIDWKDFEEGTCPVCGKKFKYRSSKKQTYCGHDCYIQARFHDGIKVAK